MTANDKIDEAFAKLPNTQEAVPLAADPNILLVRWQRTGMGFGEVTMVIRLDGSIHIDDELMGRAFVKEVFNALIDQAVLSSDTKKT